MAQVYVYTETQMARQHTVVRTRRKYVNSIPYYPGNNLGLFQKKNSKISAYFRGICVFTTIWLLIVPYRYHNYFGPLCSSHPAGFFKSERHMPINKLTAFCLDCAIGGFQWVLHYLVFTYNNKVSKCPVRCVG